MNFTKWYITIFIMVGLVLANVLIFRHPAPVVRAGSELPVRATPTPTPAGGDDDDRGPIGAYIELQVAGPPVGAWTVVQWQDSANGWHDVEGWQGSVGASGYQLWWVAAKDFGTGPFRWVVKQGSGGPVLGTSEVFNLPGGANETVQVTVSIAK